MTNYQIAMRYILIALTLLGLSACSSFEPSALNYDSITLENKRSPLEYGVYTPPDWQPEEQLPLVMFLHGGGGSHYSFERYGGHLELDRLMPAGALNRAVVVFPNGDNGFWENWADGTRHYRDWVIDSVLPSVQQQYNTLDCPKNCHIVGISMGGFGALRMAHFHPDTFESVSAISAPIFTKPEERPSLLLRLLIPFKRIFGDVASAKIRDTNPYYSWSDKQLDQKMRLQLVWGDHDHKGIREANENFQRRLSDHHVAHETLVYQGGHKWKFWVPIIENVIKFSLAVPKTESK